MTYPGHRFFATFATKAEVVSVPNRQTRDERLAEEQTENPEGTDSGSVQRPLPQPSGQEGEGDSGLSLLAMQLGGDASFRLEKYKSEEYRNKKHRNKKHRNKKHRATNARHQRHSPLYSRFVSSTKVVFPSLAVILTASVVVWPQLANIGSDTVSMGLDAIGKERGGEERLVNAQFYGADRDNQPYAVTADKAEETGPGSRVIRLENPQAGITLTDGAQVRVSSQNGLYNQETSELALLDGVSLYHDGEYELHTDQASIALTAGTAHGDSSVQGQGPFGTLQSEGFRLDHAKQSIIFTGKARLILWKRTVAGPLSAPSSSSPPSFSPPLPDAPRTGTTSSFPRNFKG